jgi:pimeloyl-ACP methyl ester carboxylesterase
MRRHRDHRLRKNAVIDAAALPPGMPLRLRRCLRLAALAAGLAAMTACAPLFSSREEEMDKRVTLRAGPSPGLTLAVEEAGRGDPVLLLHGLGTSGYSWRHVAPELAKTHRVIALDLKGFGASDKPDDGRYSVRDQAAVVKAFIEQENLRNLTVVGHSFGGGVALALALSFAEEKSGRLKRIVLLDTIAYKQPLPIFFQLLLVPGVGQAGLTVIPPEVQIAQALEIAYYDDKKIPAASIIAYAQPLYAMDAKIALRRTVEQIVPPDIEEFSKRYSSIRLPTLIIWCEQDEIIPFAYGRRLAQDIRGATLHRISQCGHLPHEEQPEETLKALRSFLRG